MTQSATATHMTARQWLAPIKPYAPELQFWGYEVGNVLAAIAGAGGFLALWHGVNIDVGSGGIKTLMTTHADIVVTLGVAIIVLWVAVLHRIAIERVSRPLELCASAVGVALIAAALWYGVNWLTASAVCFVSGSALLRHAMRWPVMLKLGGLLLSLGGVCLLATGVQAGLSVVNVLTTLTGVSVIFAGLLTYQGGVFECSNTTRAPVAGVFEINGAINQVLSLLIDRPVLLFNARISLQVAFWIGQETKENYPFLTSMWIRLPFRILLALAALATLTPQGAIFAGACVLWGIGDAAMGSLDAD